MKAIKRYSIVVFLFNSIITSSLLAHGPLAHWSFGPDAALKPYQNLPDYMSSRSIITDVSFDWLSLTAIAGMEASTMFGWTHGCQRNGVSSTIEVPIPLGEFTGLVWAEGIYPNAPTVYATPSGVELPSLDMYHIYNFKLLPENKENTMKPTAQGFLCHNLEDSLVHFRNISKVVAQLIGLSIICIKNIGLKL